METHKLHSKKIIYVLWVNPCDWYFKKNSVERINVRRKEKTRRNMTDKEERQSWEENGKIKKTGGERQRQS